jgi:hypothetical protein
MSIIVKGDFIQVTSKDGQTKVYPIEAKVSVILYCPEDGLQKGFVQVESPHAYDKSKLSKSRALAFAAPYLAMRLAVAVNNDVLGVGPFKDTEEEAEELEGMEDFDNLELQTFFKIL